MKKKISFLFAILFVVGRGCIGQTAAVEKADYHPRQSVASPQEVKHLELKTWIRFFLNNGIPVRSSAFLNDAISVETREVEKEIESLKNNYIIGKHELAPIEYLSDGSIRCVIRAVVKPELDMTPHKVFDLKGNSAEIVMAILSDTYSWKRGSETKIEFGSGDMASSADVSDILKQQFGTYNSRKLLKECVEIVVVGTSSSLGYRSDEENRSTRRVQNLAEIVSSLLRRSGCPSKPVYCLDLGQYVPSEKNFEDSAEQRPIIVIAVIKKFGQVDLEEAVTKEMEGNSLPSWFKVQDYSRKTGRWYLYSNQSDR